jgi:hypothetical protein
LPAVLAAVLYLAVALWANRVILPAPSRGLPYPTALRANWLTLSLGDELLTATLTARNAHQLVAAPWNLFDNGQCWPTADPAALGEHMFGMGLRGIVPWALTHDPVLTFNAVAIGRLWLAGMLMFAFVAYWTGDAVAALVAGLAFACEPWRVSNPMHAYIDANEWTLLALLAAHRLFARGSWAAAAALAGALALQLLESIYPVLALVILGGVYGAYLAARHWRQWRALVPRLVAVVAVAVVVAVLIFSPYLRLKAEWGALGGRTPVLFRLADFWFGGQAYAGTVVLVLATMGLVDRVRRRRDGRGHDPRLALALGGLLVLATAVDRLPLPFGAGLPSLFTVVARVVPGLDAIRGTAVIGRGVALVLTVLAGYGVLALVENRTDRVRALAGAGLAAAVLAEVFVPALAAPTFGTAVTMAANDVAPPPELLALYGRAPDGPLLDVPFAYGGAGILYEQPHYVFLGGYHRHPVGACYNSFIVQVQHDIEALAGRVPARDAVDALAAIGFRSLVVHDELLGRTTRRLAPLAGVEAAAHPPDPAETHLTLVGQAASHSLYVLPADTPAVTGYDALAVPEPATASVTARPPTLKINAVLHNRAAVVYRHPEPIAPETLLVRWRGADDAIAREDRVRTLLPLALGPDQGLVRPLEVPVAVAPGEYEVAVVPAAAPDTVIARQHVRVEAAP